MGHLRTVASALALLGLWERGAAVKPSTKFLQSSSNNGTVAATQAQAGAASGAPCGCESNNAEWKKSTRTSPKCIFIDLGAADGNSFSSFLANAYGPVSNCPNGQWEAYLVEANPRFNAPLNQLTTRFPESVHVFGTTAAYDCEGHTSFYLDTVNTQQNYWGSSLSVSHPDIQKSGKEHVDVTLVNLNRLLAEKTIANDWVMVKMDIEGAEWDIMPCLAEADSASLIDRLYMEVHSNAMSMRHTDTAAFNAAKAKLQKRGVDIPDYFSNTL